MKSLLLSLVMLVSVAAFADDVELVNSFECKTLESGRTWYVNATVYGEKLSDTEYLPKYADLVLSFNDGDDAHNARVRSWNNVPVYTEGFFSTKYANERVSFEAFRDTENQSTLAYEDKELTLVCNY